jgi:hypothetical protein
MINPVNWFWNKYFEYDMRPENRKKALNAAFYAVLIQTTLTLIAIFFWGFSGSVYVYFELAAFFILGLLTKLDKPKASLLLVILFITDRIFTSIYILNISSQQSSFHQLTTVLAFFAWSIILWGFYYRAFVFQKISLREDLYNEHQSDSGQKQKHFKFLGSLKPKILLGVVCIIFVIALIAGLFYWFEWRPAEVRKKCFENPESKVNGIVLNRESAKITTGSQWNTLYRLCLVSNGMEAEDLLKTSQ